MPFVELFAEGPKLASAAAVAACVAAATDEFVTAAVAPVDGVSTFKAAVLAACCTFAAVALVTFAVAGSVAKAAAIAAAAEVSAGQALSVSLH